MKILLRKMAAFFGSGPGRGARRRSRSWSSKSGRSASTGGSAGASTRSSGGSTGTSSHGSVKSSSKVLVRLKSWFERTKVAPPGYFSVDVGKEKIRYLIPIAYLSHEDLQKLLDDSVAEFGHSYAGALQLVCDEEELKEVLDMIHVCYESEGEDDSQRLLAGKSHT